MATSAPAASVTQSTAAAPVRVGHYRWYICALRFFATTINYVDQQVIGVVPGMDKHITQFEVDGFKKMILHATQEFCRLWRAPVRASHVR